MESMRKSYLYERKIENDGRDRILVNDGAW